MKKTLLISAALLAAKAFALAPEISYSGDTITVTVPSGLVETNSTLTLYWGSTDAGTATADWEHSLVVSADGVTGTGGVFEVSAQANGIAAGQYLQSAVTAKRSFKGVEYLDSSANVLDGKEKTEGYKYAYIDTGVPAKSGLHVQMRMQWLAFADSDCCGARYTNGDKTRFYMIHTYNSKWFLGYEASSVNTTACALNTIYDVDSKLVQGSQTLKVDGNSVYSMSNNNTVDPQCNLALFASRYNQIANGVYVRLAAKIKCYSFKLWKEATADTDGTLSLDFVPVKDSDGHGAFYDRISGDVYLETTTSPSDTHLACGEETGETYFAENIFDDFLCEESSLYDPNGEYKLPPSGFTLAASGDNAYTFTYNGLGSYSQSDISATKTIGSTTVNGVIDWTEKTITFAAIPVAADAEALVRIIYDSEQNLAFESRYPVLAPEPTAWFSGTPDAPGSAGTMSDGVYVPYSKADADLKVIDFTCTFDNVTDSGATAPSGAKFGIEIRGTESGNRFYVVAGGVWREIDGSLIVPDPTHQYAVKVLLDRTAGTVTYYVTSDGFSVKLGSFANAASAGAFERIAFDGAGTVLSFAGARRGLAADYRFSAEVNKRVVKITVDPDADCDGCGLILAYDSTDKGDEAVDWSDYVVVESALTAAGGVFEFDTRTSEIPSGSFVRAFLTAGSIEFVEYLKAKNNDCYLYTGVKAKYGLRAETKMQWHGVASNSDVCYLGARYSNASGSNTRVMMIHAYPGQWGLGYLTGHWSNGTITNDIDYVVESIMYKGDQRLIVDGVTKYSGTDSGEPSYTVDLSLFCQHYETGTERTCYSKATCYYLKIYENGDPTTNPQGDLVRDYVPAKKGTELGLYDLKNRTFTAGSGTLVCGSVTNSIQSITDISAVSSALQIRRTGLVIIIR